MTRTPETPGNAVWPLASLVIANLLPLLGVPLWGWSLSDLLMLYWLENAVVGLFTVLSLLVVRPDGAALFPLVVAKLFSVPFFVVHYGLFWLGHGIFLMTFFGGGAGGLFGAGGSGSLAPGIAGLAGSFFFSPVHAALANAEVVVWPLALILVSHGVAFVTDFLAKGEFRTAAVNELMMRPYVRVVVLHVTIVLGGFVALALGPSVGVLLLFVLVKIVADVAAYLRMRRPRGIAVQPDAELVA